jgi:catechol 2,3-dioxygenase-like lactoylglutathione lyase family enzyme
MTLQTRDVAALQGFYGELLGMQVENNATGLTVYTRDAKLVFVPVENGNPFYHFAFNIPSNKIEEARSWLKEKTELTWIEDYKSDIADFVNWHAKSVYFFDPAGNIVEFIARFDLGIDTSEPFTASQILSISEAGLVFKEDELDARTNRLLTDYHLTYFDKQPPLPQFRAIGDDEGLIIIVPSKRNWYPTNIPSAIFPLSMEFVQEGRTCHFQY